MSWFYVVPHAYGNVSALFGIAYGLRIPLFGAVIPPASTLAKITALFVFAFVVKSGFVVRSLSRWFRRG